MTGIIDAIKTPTLTDGELHEVQDRLSHPVVQKYFASLAIPIVLDLALNVEPQTGESAESFLRRRTNEHGRLEVLNTLLSIPAKQ